MTATSRLARAACITGLATGGVQLRPYQLDAVERVRAALRRVRRVLLCAPTGSGKTIVAAFIILAAYKLGKRVVFFAHRRELIDQCYGKLVAAGIPETDLGVMMGDDRRTNPDAPIQIVSISTYRHRDPPLADIVFFDEAHGAIAPSRRAAIEHYAGLGAVILGLSATPFRADNGGLGDLFSELVLVASVRELIDAGYLVEPRVFTAARRPDLSIARVRHGDYVEADLWALMSPLVGDIVAHYQRLAPGLRAVVFAVSIAHSRAIVVAFVAAGIPAEHLDGETPIAERAAILARLERGETLVVSNCGVLCEGWDMPCVKVAILARPTKSLGLYLQQAGRILRPWNDTRAIILDHAGNALEHGLPQDDRTFTLDRSRPKRSSPAPMKACPECGCTVATATRECAECGHVFVAAKVAAVDAPSELREIKAHTIRLAVDPRALWILGVESLPDLPGVPASPRQLAALSAAGVRATSELTLPQATHLLDLIAERRAQGRATVKQALQLASRGLAHDVSFELAREVMDAIRNNRWRTPPWVQRDPRLQRSTGVSP